MNKVKLLPLILWFGILTSFIPSSVLADELEIIAQELRPLSGIVVMPLQDQILINLDAEDGLQMGDLVSVISGGEKIIHPVSGKVLGYLETTKAVLKVTRIKSGYSYAKVIRGKGSILKGEVVKSYSALTAALYTPRQFDTKFYGKLRKRLPELEWQGEFTTLPSGQSNSNVDLSFVVTGTQLNLLDHEGVQVRSFSLLETLQPARLTQPIQQPPKAARLPQPTGITWDSDIVKQGQLQQVGNLPGEVLMASFLQLDDRLLVATVDRTQVQVSDLREGVRLVSSSKIAGGAASPLAVSWWRPEKGKDIYLAVTASHVVESYLNSEEIGLSGTIFRYSNSRLTPVATHVPYFLTSYDRDGDEQPETLMGQEFDLERTFGRIVELNLVGTGVKSRKPSFALPSHYVLPGSTMGDLNGDGQSELVSINNKVLKIYSAKKEIYSSRGQNGGSLATLSYDLNPGLEDSLFTVISLETQPIIRDIDGDKVAELLLISSERSSLRVPGIDHGIKKSWIAVGKYSDGTLVEGRLDFDRKEPILGLWFKNSKLYFVEASAGKENSSSLLRYELRGVQP